MYFDHLEPVKRVPSHRLLAMQRGEADGLLRVSIELDDDFVLGKLKPRLVTNRQFEFHSELLATVEDCYQRLLLPATESATLQELKERADEEAIQVFTQNLRELLLSPPAGPRVTLGIDPGFRTGCKVAVVDGTGKFLDSRTIFPTPPRNDIAGASATLRDSDRPPQRPADRHRQRHGLPRNGRFRQRPAEGTPPAGRRPAAAPACRSRCWSASRVRRSIRPANWPPTNIPIWMSPSAARSASRIGCRTRWPSWSRSIPSPSASASISMT